MFDNGKIKIKHFYRFVEFVSKLLKADLPHERFKLLALDEFKAESKTELKIKALADSYMYLINNINQSLTTKIIKNAYFLLTGIMLNEETLNKILEIYYQNYDESSHYLATLVHFAVLDNVAERKIEFAFMLSNLIMYKKKRNPFIPYEFITKEYFEAILKRDLNKLMYVFASIEVRYKTLLENKNLTFDDIIYVIKENKTILKNKYNVKKIYLYGSFAKHKVSESSDLDLLVIYDRSLMTFERINKTEELKEFLSQKLQIHIDLIDFSLAIREMDICEMENIITLI